MEPLNDLCMVELKSDEYGFGAEGKETAESGILITLPEIFHYFGMWSFAFEKSFMAKEDMEDLLDYWKTKVGRKVFWTALSERGNIIKKDGKRYAFIKLTSLIAEDEPDSEAESVHSDGAGSFGVES